MQTKPLVRGAGEGMTLSLEEQVRLRARELYIEGGNQSGSELDDWLQAEEELSALQDERVERD